jgi:SOS-response transcriptional repressor LexA
MLPPRSRFRSCQDRATGDMLPKIATSPSSGLFISPANDRYGLRIQDDSLVAALICKGDLVVVQPQSHAAAGQLAIVRTGDAETCLRFWIPEGGRIRLQPPLRSLPPTIVDRAEVLGVVVAVIRSLLPQPPLELS